MMNTTTIDGATVGWTDTGTGEDTLLVHAGGFGAWFAPLPQHLPGRVIRMLRAGYTGGPPPPDPIEIVGHAAHVATLLARLDATPSTVVSHSSGCAVALQLALDAPELVSRLVLCEPPLIDGLLDPVDLDEVHATLGPVPAAFNAFFAAVCGPDYRSVLDRVLGPDGLVRAERDAVFFFADEVPALGRWTPGNVTELDVPVLLVQGGDSPGPTHRLIARLAAALPDAHVATIPGPTTLPLTHAAELAELVSCWTREAPAERTPDVPADTAAR